jgi:hypothetical protein
MNDLTPTYEPETGQVVLDGSLAGPAGEAVLVPTVGVELAFDRADGRLVRVSADVADDGAAALLARLFGPQAPQDLRVLSELAARTTQGPRALSSEPMLCAALSSLALLDAARNTSPVPRSSPWWAAEAAVLAEQAGLHERALAEARTASRLRDRMIVASECGPGLDVAAEVAGLEKDAVGQPGLQRVLDPGLVPAGLFRHGLSPHSDLLVHHDGAAGRVTVDVALAPDADGAAVDRCEARLVDPAVRRVLARAPFHATDLSARADLRLPFPLDELDEAWIEVVEGPHCPVRSAKGRRIRRALRWADAALRAERAPAGLARRASAEDWAALAAIAWERCRRDWESVGDSARTAALAAPRIPGPSPACLAEFLGG